MEYELGIEDKRTDNIQGGHTQAKQVRLSTSRLVAGFSTALTPTECENTPKVRLPGNSSRSRSGCLQDLIHSKTGIVSFTFLELFNHLVNLGESLL